MQPATQADAMRAPVPPAPLDRGTIVEEILVVLSLSVLRSAAFAILSLLEAPIAGVVVAAADQSTEFARQLLGFVFALAPVFLVVHLVRRSGEGVGVVGLRLDRPGRDAARGALVFVLVGVAGIGIYLAGSSCPSRRSATGGRSRRSR
jgi:hypothetical protein